MGISRNIWARKGVYLAVLCLQFTFAPSWKVAQLMFKTPPFCSPPAFPHSQLLRYLDELVGCCHSPGDAWHYQALSWRLQFPRCLVLTSYYMEKTREAFGASFCCWAFQEAIHPPYIHAREQLCHQNINRWALSLSWSCCGSLSRSRAATTLIRVRKVVMPLLLSQSVPTAFLSFAVPIFHADAG